MSLLSKDEKSDDALTPGENETPENSSEGHEGVTSALLDGIDLNSILEDPSGLVDTFKGIIGGVIDTINADQEGFKINLAGGLVLMLVNMLTGKKITADKFLQLNPEASYLEFYWEYAAKLSLGIDPLKLAVGLSQIKIELGGSASVLPSDFNKANYMSATQLDELSLQMSLDLNATLKGQDEQIRLEKYLDVLVADLGLKLGIDFPTVDMDYKFSLTLGANLTLNDPNRTEIEIEILNMAENAVRGEIVMGIYIVGPELYVDMGKLADQAIRVTNTDLADRICAFISKLLGRINEEDLLTSSDAYTASDDVSADEALGIMLTLANGKLGVLIAENIIIGLISALAGNNEVVNGKSLTEIIQEFGLDLVLDVDISLDPVAFNLSLDSSLIALEIALSNLGLATEVAHGVALEEGTDVLGLHGCALRQRGDILLQHRTYLLLVKVTDDGIDKLSAIAIQLFDHLQCTLVVEALDIIHTGGEIEEVAAVLYAGH